MSQSVTNQGGTTGIEVHQFSVQYPDFSMTPLSLTVSPGERVALVGPNGSGKTTLLKALGGRLPAYTGRVQVDGRDIKDQIPDIRQRIGFLPEDLLGYGWMTVGEHLRLLSRFYDSWSDRTSQELCELLELSTKAKLGTLSKGMKVKLSFVAAEAYGSPYLLLDEPTSGLDPLMRRKLMDVILERVRGSDRIVFFSTHLLEDVEWIATRVMVLNDGRLITDAAVDDLRRRWSDKSLSEILYSTLDNDQSKTLRRADSD